jgi:hypothetical protein
MYGTRIAYPRRVMLDGKKIEMFLIFCRTTQHALGNAVRHLFAVLHVKKVLFCVNRPLRLKYNLTFERAMYEAGSVYVNYKLVFDFFKSIEKFAAEFLA